MELDSVLRKVRALVAKAEHPNTPAEEAASAREMADALMLKYQIDHIAAEDAKPISDRQKPDTITVLLGMHDDILGFTASMARNLAQHCRCLLRPYTEWTGDGWLAKVYGFESDLKYFEIMYTQIRLHMLGAFMPKWNSEDSLEDNCYRLHNAGYNWLGIAEIDGWRKCDAFSIYDETSYNIKVPYRHKETGEVKPATQVGSHYKRAYYRAIAARDETATQIPASGSQGFRLNALNGYTIRLSMRLREVADRRTAGSEIILASSLDEVRNLFHKDDPEPREYKECEKCKKSKSGYCRDHPKGAGPRQIPWNEEAYRKGAAHADGVLLGPAAESGARREIG